MIEPMGTLLVTFHILGIMAAKAWYSHRSYFYQEPPCFQNKICYGFPF